MGTLARPWMSGKSAQPTISCQTHAVHIENIMNDKNPQSGPPQGDLSQQAHNPYHSPAGDFDVVGEAVGQHQPTQGDSTGGVIPYKNPHALIAYYLGIISLLPIIGVPFGLASVILGIMGLSRRKKNPVIKGSVHAWIGIVFGSLSLFCGTGLLVAMIVGAVGSAR